MSPHSSPPQEPHDRHHWLHDSQDAFAAYRHAIVEIVTPMFEFNRDVVGHWLQHWLQVWSGLAYRPDVAARAAEETQDTTDAANLMSSAVSRSPAKQAAKKMAALQPHIKSKGATAAHRHIATNAKKRSEKTHH
ncbi:MAG: hypothetical protein EPO06_09325 [Burkholderiaceae bacterium]|nr:MAG: hypothetical protein EPO06_09325 [Burkholderiaceae bacterium]